MILAHGAEREQGGEKGGRDASHTPDRLLLDTHVVVWWRSERERLSRPVQHAIGQAAEVFVSAASVWEFSIKASLGKIALHEGTFAGGVAASGFAPLPVTFAHADAVRHLSPHHGDPFDRLLVAQAQLEGLVLVTHDARLAQYGVPVLPA